MKLALELTPVERDLLVAAFQKVQLDDNERGVLAAALLTEELRPMLMGVLHRCPFTGFQTMQAVIGLGGRIQGAEVVKAEALPEALPEEAVSNGKAKAKKAVQTPEG